MRRSVLALLGILLPTAAFGADLTVPYKAPGSAAVSPDSGFYLKTEIGGSAGTGNVSFASVPAFAESFQPSGFVAGGGIGYKWRAGFLLLGVVADADYAWTNGGGNCAGGLATCGLSSHILLTQRGIVGLPLFNTQAMVGITAGAAERGLTANVLPIGTSNQWATGWTAGGIIEAPIANHLTLGLEVLYINYNATATMAANALSVIPGTASLSLNQEVVAKASFNWHF
jgi:outer membrane immunogenic protein